MSSKNKELFIDQDHRLDYMFGKEYRDSIFWSWSAYIESKDLGIVLDKTNKAGTNKYLITNKKQLMLSRIKYGF